jgi:RimJ/RimL family protein N-acetyltransferase
MVRDDWPLEQALSRVPDVVRWTLYPPNLSDSDAQERTARIEQAGRHGRLRRYRIIANEDTLGTAGISNNSTTDEVEVFYALLPSGRGRGAATIATRTLSDWGLDHGARQVLLLTIPGNAASEAVARRAGFAVEGREVRLQRGKEAEMLRWAKGPSPT